MKPSKLATTFACSAAIALTACAVADLGPRVGTEADSFNYLSVWESQLPDPVPVDSAQEFPMTAPR